MSAAPRLARDLAALDVSASGPQAVFAVARRIELRRTQKGDPFVTLELCDCSATYKAKIWANAGEAMEVAQDLRAGTPVKVLAEISAFQGQNELDIKKLRVATDADAEEGYEPARLYGAAHALVREVACDTLVIDIETVPTVDLRKAPATIAQAVSKAAEQRQYDEAKVMGLSPFFGQVVSLAVGDGNADPSIMPVTVFVVPPRGHEGKKLPSWVRAVSERELIEAFWGLAALAETVVTFNGFYFDIPYLVARSVVLGVPARVDLLSQRYATKPHCDVLRVFTQDSRSLQPATLEIVCWALGIQSPKGDMDGSLVAPTYQAGDIEKIAVYNAADVRATAAVYRRLAELVLRYR